MLLELMLEELNQGVIVCDKQGKIVLYNRAYGEVDKMSPDQVLDKTIEKSYSMDKGESVLRQVMNSRQPILVHRQQYTTKTGYFVDVVKDTYPILWGDDVLGAFAIVRDFSNAKAWASNIVREVMDNSSKEPDEQLIDFANLTSQHPRMSANLDAVKKLLIRFQNTAIFGDIGTECKEIAKYIIRHYAKSPRIISFDCASVAPDAQTVALFGNKQQEVMGVLHNLGGEILLLEHPDFLAIDAQIKLKEYILEAKPSIITIFNKEPHQIFHEGKLTLELFYLLNQTYLQIPPLKERRGDIPAYLDGLCHHYNQMAGTQCKLSLSAYRALVDYDWPGNFLEMQHVIKSAINHVEGTEIALNHIPQYIANGQIQRDQQGAQEDYTHLDDILAYTERAVITAALHRHHHNVSKAADDLGISRQKLQYRMKILKL